MKQFPKNFLFSTSSNAFQVEGARSVGGRKESIWDRFTKENFFIPAPNEPGREINSIEVASNFYDFYKEDINLMKKAGLNAHVYNMDWARIMPDNTGIPNEEGLQWYENVFKEFNKNNIKLIPILYHWDTPQWLEDKGGTSGEYFVEAFVKFCEIVFKRLGKYTDIWFANDENSTYTSLGYLDDYFPPAKKNRKEFWKAVHNLTMSGAKCKQVFDIAKKKGYISKNAILGIDHDWNQATPYDPNDKDDVEATRIFNLYDLDLFLNPNILGEYPQIFFEELEKENLSDIITTEDKELLKKYTLDLIGWNYYRPAIIASPKRKNENIKWKKPFDTFITDKALIVYPIDEKYTDWGWMIDPKKLRVGAKTLYKKYNKKLMIIENGIGYFDKRVNGEVLDDYRIDFLNVHLREVQKSIEDGIPFIGYSAWSFTDIFSPSGGYRKKYGIVDVNYEDETLSRKPKLSYYWYKNVIKNNSTDEKPNIDSLIKIMKNNN